MWSVRQVGGVLFRFLPMEPLLPAAVIALAMYAIVDPRLVAQEQVARFPLTWAFFQTYLAQGGALADWLSLGMVQLFAFDWLGAILVGLLCLGALATAGPMIANRPLRYAVLGLLAAALLLVHSAYTYDLVPTVGLVVALSAATAAGQLRFRPLPMLAMHLLAAGIVYWVAGACAWEYVAVASLLQLRRPGSKVWALAWLILPAILMRLLALMASGGHGQLIPTSIAHGLDGPWQAVATFVLWLAVPAGLAAQFGGDFLARRRGRVAPTKPAPAPKKPAPKPKAARLRPLLSPALYVAVVLGPVAAVAAVEAFSESAREARAPLEIEYASAHRQWARILGFARARPDRAKSLRFAMDLQRALYFTGRLGEDLFRFPQEGRMSYGINEVDHWPDMRRIYDLCLDLGRINDCEAVAHEALVIIGPRPDILQRLAEIKRIKRQPEQARIFLRALQDDLILGSWARAGLEQLRADPKGERVAQYKSLRELTPTVDDYHGVYAPDMKAGLEIMLAGLMLSNKQNRMAYEYVMTSYLIRRDLGPFMEALPMANALRFQNLPRHWEEAVLISCTQAQKPVPPGFPIRPETVDRYRKVLQAIQTTRDPNELTAIMKRDFGETYFCYFSCRGAP